MTPSPESKGSVATAEQASATRGLAMRRGAILTAFNVELVGFRSGGRRRRTESTSRKEQAPDRMGSSARVRRSVFMEVTGRSQDIESLLVRLGEPLLALEHTSVNGGDRGVALARVVDQIKVTQRSLGVKQVVRPSSEGDPLAVRHELSHVNAELSPGLLDRSGHSALPLVKGSPSGLDGANDTLLEVGGVLLHDDDGFLEGVFLVDLSRCQAKKC